ncbi:hypothetical protein CRUP_026775 [Coryphaenoides rupestris]|nr:hypothetical protein CRUP_026775 [Coryphaenoides rupestris]
MDLQLTNIEHFSECDIQAKVKQLRAFQQEISLTSPRIEVIFKQAEALMEKCEPLDATVIEEEQEELRRYCQEVFGRVERYHKKLLRLPLTDDDTEEVSFSDRELDLDEGDGGSGGGDASSGLPWGEGEEEGEGDGCFPASSSSPLPSSGRRAERSGRDTPASVDSIPLEWDHDYDLSRGLESAGIRAGHRGQHGAEEGGIAVDFLLLQRPASAMSDVVIPDSPEAYVRLTENALRSTTGDAGSSDSNMAAGSSGAGPSDGGRGSIILQQLEAARSRAGAEPDASYMGYMRLLGECRGSIDQVKKMGSELKEEEDGAAGLADPSSSESQSSGVITRWELLQAQDLNKELRTKQSQQQWQQLTSDLRSVWAWLGQAGEELEQQRGLELCTDIQTIQLRIKKLKELQKALDKRKAIVLSINLCSVEFVQGRSEESRELQARLTDMNNHWDKLGAALDEWRASLQDALMQCQDFHETSHGLLLWLENIDRRRNEVTPINPVQDADTLQQHHKTLTQIRRELLDSQLKVALLQDMSLQLLVNAPGERSAECLEAKEKVHVIGNRLKLLLKEVTRDLRELAKILDISSSQQDLSSWSSTDDLDTSGSVSPASGRSTPSRRRSLLLLLLLVGVAYLLAPMTEEDYPCGQSNSFSHSFSPMLSYTNGPPPV